MESDLYYSAKRNSEVPIGANVAQRIDPLLLGKWVASLGKALSQSFLWLTIATL